MRPWWKPIFVNGEKELLAKVIEEGFPNEGEYVILFEKEIGKVIRENYVVATTSGTTALYLALKVHGIGPGDEVIVPDITFIATANAVKMTGAEPILVDVAPSGLMDSEEVRRAITSKTKAVIPVHVSGRDANTYWVNKVAKEFGILVIEDAAEAFGSRSRMYADFPLGHLNLGTLGDAGCFSFSPFKIITTGQGGAVAVSNADTYQRLMCLKDQGRSSRGTGGADKHDSLGFNFKMTNLQAAVGLAQIHGIGTRFQKMRTAYTVYSQELRDVRGVEVMTYYCDEGEIPNWIEARVTKRDELIKHLTEKGWGCRELWLPLHTQKPYQYQGERKFPHAEDVSAHHVWLPSSLDMKVDDFVSVCNIIKEWSVRQ